MKFPLHTLLTLVLCLLGAARLNAQSAWWIPEEPELGQAVTLYYDAVAGSLPNNATSVILHWGVNETGPGGWQQPPAGIWPAGTTLWSDNIAARTPLTPLGGGQFSVTIDPTEDITSIHFVVTDGTNWDNNSNQNWDLYFGEPPVFDTVWHRFIFDPASSFYAGTRTISTVNLAGTFNNWSTSADPLQPGPAGTWIVDKVIQEGAHQYKFVVNGNVWTWDPDNPLQNSNDNNNSMLDLVPDTAPVFTGFNLAENLVVDTPQLLSMQATFRDPDTGPGIDWSSAQLEIDGIPTLFNVQGNTLDYVLPLLEEGRREVRITLEDQEGDAVRVDQSAAYYTEGWHALDAGHDDDGPGYYSYPTPAQDYADLKALHLWQAADGDTLRVGVDVGDVHDYLRVVLLLTSDLYASAASDHLSEELRTPDWAAGGVLVCLAVPTSNFFDPAHDNRLILDHSPLTVGPALDVWLDGDRLVANLPMDELELHLGSWQEEWYIAAYTVLDGIQPIEGGVMEIGPAQGGLAER